MSESTNPADANVNPVPVALPNLSDKKTQSDAGDVGEVAKSLARKGRSTTVNIADLVIDRSRNPRDEKLDYDLPKLVQSFRDRGYLKSSLIVVSKRKDGTEHLLEGFQRVLALQSMPAEELDKILPGGKIPALVLSDISPADEVRIINDHDAALDRRPLSDAGLFNAVRQLMQIGITSRRALAEALGEWKVDAKTGERMPNASKLQNYQTLYYLPAYVRDEMLKFWRLGKDESRLRLNHVGTLYKAMNAEYAAFPAGDGPKLREAFDKIVNPPAADEPEPGDEPETGTALTAAKMKDAATLALSHGAVLVREAINFCQGVGNIDLNATCARCVDAERDSRIMGYLRQLPQFAELCELAGVPADELKPSEPVA